MSGEGIALSRGGLLRGLLQKPFIAAGFDRWLATMLRSCFVLVAKPRS